MSSSRKQTSLFSFFTRSDDKEDGSPSRATFSSSVMKQRENFLTEKMNRNGSMKAPERDETEERKTCGAPKRTAQDDEVCSPLKRNHTPKRCRIVLSSDSEPDDECGHENSKQVEISVEADHSPTSSDNPTSSEPCTPDLNVKPKNRTSTPRSVPRTSAASTPRLVSEMAHSFIGCFRVNEEDMDAPNVSMSSLDRSIYKVEESAACGTSKKEGGLAVLSDCEAGRFPHLDFDFLQPDKIRDANGRRISDPYYCPRTLFVPDAFIKQQTPGHRQWWLAKSAYFDTVLFFKVGKFYEMYHMDAVIGVENLNLTYMRGKFAHCGFPEIAYGRFADQLVSRGYKVARVEQTETPTQLEERNRLEKNREKVVRREICRVTSAGTRTYGVLDTCDGDCALDAVESSARHLLSFAEKVLPNGLSTYGVCFIDTSVGRFYVGQFVDDANRSSMRTLFAHYEPSQILYERGRISAASQSLLNSVASAVIKEALVPKKEFPDAESAVKMLTSKLYFGEVVREWPQTVRSLLVDADALDAKCAPEFNECMAALGAVLWYLKRSLIDVDMVTMRTFERYIPPCLLGHPASQNDSIEGMQSGEGYWRHRRLVLDGVSLYNLNIVPPLDGVRRSGMRDSISSKYSLYNTINKCITPFGEGYWRHRRLVLDGVSLYNLNIVPPLDGVRRSGMRDSISSKYSLYNTINKCITPFGKRVLRQWVCAPSCDGDVLRARQDAIQWLMSPTAKLFTDKATEVLRKMPDLERLLQKIHTLGLKYRASQHPDSRAVMFEPLRYNRRKIGDLLSALSGFERVLELVRLYGKLFTEAEQRPKLIDRCFGACFPDISGDLSHFQEAFDHEKAKAEGIIVPEKGVDAEYDGAVEDVHECIHNLDAYLFAIRKRLGCGSIQYFGSGRSRYQLEIPETIAKNLGGDFELKSSRKGYKRFSTEESVRLFEELVEAETRCDIIRRDVMRRVFADFDTRAAKWAAVTERVALFDVLLSLARYAKSSGLAMCRPEFVFDSDTPFLNIAAGYHPCLAAKMCAGREREASFTYIPNDTQLGGDHPLTMLLTGPNMGGKSTLMRQVAVLVVLAQIGSLVPAKKMRLSPVDRIFTRIGANDRISAGQSTFFVELNEANIIMRDASVYSLVVMDELGRGTRSVYLSLHNLMLRKVDRLPGLLSFMDNENDVDPTLENVTFLYSLSDGVCPKSYGFFAAKVSGIKPEVIRTAFAASQRLDMGIDGKSSRLALLVREAKKGCDVGQLSSMLASM
ncbi:DNA mismatch repair protein Msh6 [Toxocara canis]|uniref:DNA mismatch repair protein n=1 Tax=Toxocara canis TaxID=6265 RepID=A0A0B2VA79_TOXCA|nr:DNA mismatch repair protein Msh6 [Toxocara canis]